MGAFSAASAAALAATGRFMFPRRAERATAAVQSRISKRSTAWASMSGGRTSSASGSSGLRRDVAQAASGFYALISTCTHLGCTPNYLSAENKFKCPCHGSGFRLSGINFEGPAPRPLERARIVLADDGQILVDKSRHFQQELGGWQDQESFLKV